MNFFKDKNTWWQILLWPAIWIFIPVAISGFDVSDRFWMRTVFTSIAIIAMVLINLELLLPKVYFKKKYFIFIILGLLSIALLVFILTIESSGWGSYFMGGNRLRGPRSGRGNGGMRSFHQAFKYISIASPIFISWIGSSLIAVARYSNQRDKEMVQLRSEKLESEMKFLKSQTNPHFLFNALNNIYSLAVLKSDKTPDHLLKLSEMLRYMLYECRAEKVPLQKEVDYMFNFIDLYKLKDSEQFNIEVDTNIKSNLMVGSLLFVPFIENAFKHSKVEDIEKGWIKISVETLQKNIIFKISNSKPIKSIQKDKVGGIGLNNVKRQLELLYPNKHELSIHDDTDKFDVFLKINTE